MPSESVLHWQCQVPMLKWHVASFQSLRHMVPANHKGPGMILYYVPRGGEPEIVGNQHYPHAMDNPMMFAGKTSLQPTSRNEAPLVFCDYKEVFPCVSQCPLIQCIPLTTSTILEQAQSWLFCGSRF